MLIFIGTGLWDERDISLRALEAAREADEVYVEFYTSKPSTTAEGLSNLIGKEVIELQRSDLEEKSHELVKRAKNRVIALMIPGDPMIATTHSAIRLQAAKEGVKTRIIHSSSIISAVCGITGLHNYRFGRSATVSYPYEDMVSRTPADVILANERINAHTLLFLDLHPEPMRINQAIDILERIDAKLLERYAVGIARAGSPDCFVRCDTLERLRKIDFGDPMHVLVVLSRLHFTEFEYLRVFASAPDDLENFVE